jgi:kumamolisin
MLPFKDHAGLEAFIADVSNPQSPNYGHYLTIEEENARFNPDVAREQRVSTWLAGANVSGVQLVPNHLYVYAQASAGTFSKLLNVQINDYRAGSQTFYAPDRVPTLPASVSGDINWISGLSNEDILQTFHVVQPGSGGKAGTTLQSRPQNSPPYTPQDMATAYNANTLLASHNGAGTNIAITLWTLAPSDATLNYWSSITGSPVATRGNGRLAIILTDGSQSGDNGDGEAALDIESSSGFAAGMNIRYYEATEAQFSNMANALNIAGTDAANNRFITNSWGGPESTSARNVTEPVVQANTATGHDYLFSSGDDGSWANGQDPFPSYPAASAYVTAIGGTRFNADINGTWPGEQSWLYDPTGNNGHPEGTGGGFSSYSPRPAWQVAPGFPNYPYRGYPDISSEGDPETGLYVCGDYDGCFQVGGTSLSSPLWAAMLNITDQYVVGNGGAHLGFVNPALYVLAQNAQQYAPYHDITIGTNGTYTTGPGWDAVTGLGTPDLYNFARDLAPAGPPPPPCPGEQFTDVCPGSTFYTPISNLVSAGVINGYSSSPPCPAASWIPCFLPGNTATRGQIAKIITLGAGLTINTTGGPHFTDVAADSTFYQYIETLYNAGIISGYSDGTFRPGNPVTRGQLSKMASLAFNFNETVTNQTFQDVPPGSTFYDYIGRLSGRGIINGYACGGAGEPCGPGNLPYFRPSNAVTRGQLSKIVDLCMQQ